MYDNRKKVSLKELVSKEQVFAVCVWDCYSAFAAEKAGFKAILLSSAAFANSHFGLPDFKFITIDDMVDAVKRICDYSPLPLIVDAEDVYSASPMVVYRNVKRLIEAGASAISVDDAHHMTGFQRLWHYREKNHITDKDFFNNLDFYKVIPREDFYQKIKAAVAACEGTDCMIIARSEAKMKYGLDEAIERCRRASELGAPMTLCLGIDNLEESKRVADALPGWKMYPDVVAKNGVPDVELQDVEKLGFNLVTHHCLEKGAMYGMLLFGTNNKKNNNSVFSDTYDTSEFFVDLGVSKFMGGYEEWLDREDQFLDV